MINPEPDGSSAVVPPDPEFDETRWLIGPTKGRSVEVTTRVERVWWSLEGGDGARGHPTWTDRPLDLCRGYFKATSPAEIVLRLPCPGWPDAVRIGFDAARARDLYPSASNTERVIPLRDLGQCREVEEGGPASLKAWLTPAESRGDKLELVVGFLPDETALRSEEARFLRLLDKIQPRSVMAVLARLQPLCRGPLARMVYELQMDGYNKIPKRQRRIPDEAFVREALCVLALVVEQLEPRGLWKAKLPEGWIRRTRAAKAHLPAVMSAVRSWHLELEHQFATNHGVRSTSR
jgi:hypothetical protein